MPSWTPLIHIHSLTAWPFPTSGPALVPGYRLNEHSASMSINSGKSELQADYKLEAPYLDMVRRIGFTALTKLILITTPFIQIISLMKITVIGNGPLWMVKLHKWLFVTSTVSHEFCQVPWKLKKTPDVWNMCVGSPEFSVNVICARGACMFTRTNLTKSHNHDHYHPLHCAVRCGW